MANILDTPSKSPEMQPLTGLRIVTIALNVPGPMAAQRLCDFGAFITKIEPPDGDALKASSPHWYNELVRGMKVESCDIKTEAGHSRIRELLAEADLLLTAQRLAALKRLGLDWQTLHVDFPQLCQVAIVGYPPPKQDMAGHDLTYLASNGLLRPPVLPNTLFADVGGSEQAVVAALAVLMERQRTGTGQYAEVALADTAKRLAAPLEAGLTLPGAILGGGFPGYNLYAAKDGWVAVAALEPRFYQRLCHQLGISEPSYESFVRRFAAESCAYWQRIAKEQDLPIAVVQNSPTAQ